MKKGMMQKCIIPLLISHREAVNRDAGVRMCYEQYTRRNIIRTGEIRERITLIAFAVIGHEIQVIIKNIYGIHKRFNDVQAEERIVPVAFCKPVEKKQNTVPVQQLSLGVSEGLHRYAQIFGLVFQFFQVGGG